MISSYKSDHGCKSNALNKHLLSTSFRLEMKSEPQYIRRKLFGFQHKLFWPTYEKREAEIPRLEIQKKALQNRGGTEQREERTTGSPP